MGMVTIGFVALMSTEGVVQLGPFWQDFSVLGNTRTAQVSEFFDGYDWEVQAWDYRAHYATDNGQDDRNGSSSGAVAVWQRLTDQGWEIILWSLLEQTEFQVTHNEIDDVDPKTDGRYLVWRAPVDDVWSVLMMDLRYPDRAPERISTGGAVDAVVIKEGVIVWQEWVGDSWEIMMARPFEEALRVTDNRTADIGPRLFDGSIYFEGEDPDGGDREIFRYNFWQGETQIVTQNELDDDALSVVGEKVQWSERREGITAIMELDEATVRSRIVELIVSVVTPILEGPAQVQTASEEATEVVEATADTEMVEVAAQEEPATEEPAPESTSEPEQELEADPL